MGPSCCCSFLCNKQMAEKSPTTGSTAEANIRASRSIPVSNLNPHMHNYPFTRLRNISKLHNLFGVLYSSIFFCGILASEEFLTSKTFPVTFTEYSTIVLLPVKL